MTLISLTRNHFKTESIKVSLLMAALKTQKSLRIGSKTDFHQFKRGPSGIDRVKKEKEIPDGKTTKCSQINGIFDT